MNKILMIITLFFFCASGFLVAQTKNITGTVVDKATGEPLPGVTVIVKGTTDGTITMVDGTYNISIAPDVKILQFTFIGYQIQEQLVADQSVINVQLLPEVTDLDEVIVTGYGITKRGTYTGSVEVIDAKALEQVPVASFDQALQGQAAGLVAVSSSGAPGAAATVRIRGISSISSGNNPLYIMDGIPISAGQFSSLNQNDIESVSVLKDATATSLYGSRASSGVIVITTKRGKSVERTKFQYRGQYGINTIAGDNFDMMNSAQKIQYEEETGVKTYTPEERIEALKTNTDWMDVVLRDAMTKSHEISAQGGNDKTRFYVSGSYYYQEGIQYSSDFERYNMRINLDNKIAEKANIGLNFTLGYEEHGYTVTDGANVANPIFAARLLNPYLKPYNEDGSFNSEGLPWSNPIEQLTLNDDNSDLLKIVGGAFFDYSIIDNLVFKTNWGVDFFDATKSYYFSPESDWGATTNGLVGRSFSRNFRLTPTNTLRYQFDVNDAHAFNMLLGQETIVNHSQSFGVSGKNISNDKLKILDVTNEIDSWSGGASDYSVASFFANMAYNYQYKYLLDLSIRRDGSSRFGKNSRWGTFWAAGIGWNMQEEAFLKDVSWIDQLKIRASVGETGNYNIGNYEHLSLFGYGSYMNNGGSVFVQYGNDDLTWEKKLKMNLALDLSVLQKYRMKLEVYNDVTSDMLFFVPGSLTNGVSGRMENIGEMTNKGIELDINADLLSLRDFKINLNANVAYNKNTVDKLYNGLEEIDQGNTMLRVGESAGTFYVTEWAGVDASNGKGMWYNKEGEVTNTYSDTDRVLQDGKSYLPPWSGGFTGTFTYKNLQLSAFFSWMADKWLINNTRYFVESHGAFGAYNQTVNMLDYWKEPGDISENPNPKYQDNYLDSRLLEDASFLRLKNVNISYNFTKEMVGKTKVFKSARIYAQGVNLLTFTKYTGIDPEFYGTNETNMYPNTKTFSLGIDLGF